MATTAEIKNGIVIHHQGGLFSVVFFQHVKPGKGPAFVRTKLKNLVSQKVIDHTFSAGHKIRTARIERRNLQFLYREEELFHFMDSTNFEQYSFRETLINHPKFLKDNEVVHGIFHTEQDEMLSIELPTAVTLKVEYTEHGIRGDTTTNPTKSATLETGAIVQVPLFVRSGESIRVNTESGTYLERA